MMRAARLLQGANCAPSGGSAAAEAASVGGPMTAPLLSIRGIAKAFGGVQALADVSFDVAAGERVAVIGPNGAGKTTLFNVITGTVRPTAGLIRFAGQPIAGLPSHRI